MPWHAQLHLDYQRRDNRTVLQHRHSGPLRILKSLYPEGDSVCHNVVVHPPGGLVGGDLLDIHLRVGSGAHAMLGTPGATRFYATDTDSATQQVSLQLDEGARLEWLPLEAIAYPGCNARNLLQATLASGAEMMGWDVTALGLALAGQPYTAGCFEQRLELPGRWLEQARLDASDTRLLQSPLGLGGQRCLGTFWLATGTPLTRDRRALLLDAVRGALDCSANGVRAAATCPNDHVLVVRAVAPVVEPLMGLLQRAWAALRPAAWGLAPVEPRIWKV
ncbi:MAG: urease accessory protein UreD [Hydrogenophaga sp.]|jgi:urease accessory protein|nr:urease accessory protein UreD [Hydrogenophaga sp.]